MPSLVARDDFLSALAIPFVRKIVSAFAKSPLASSSARLQSIIPAFVLSRSCLTNLGSISAITFTKRTNLRSEPSLGRDAGHFHLFANSSFPAGGHERVDQLL